MKEQKQDRSMTKKQEKGRLSIPKATDARSLGLLYF